MPFSDRMTDFLENYCSFLNLVDYIKILYRPYKKKGMSKL